MKISLFELQSLGQRITAIQRGDNAFQYSKTLNIDLPVVGVSKIMLRNGLTVCGTGICMGGPQLGENFLDSVLKFQAITGKYRGNFQHPSNLNNPHADVQGFTSILMKRLHQIIDRTNMTILREIGKRRLTEEEKAELKEFNEIARTNYLAQAITQNKDGFTMFQEISNLENTIVANWFKCNFPEDMALLNRYGLQSHTEEVQNNFIKRMAYMRRGTPPISFETEGDKAFIEVVFPIKSLTLLNSIFSKL